MWVRVPPLPPNIVDQKMNDKLFCDNCGKEVDNPWHYSTKDSRHNHACDECWKDINPVSREEYILENTYSDHTKIDIKVGDEIVIYKIKRKKSVDVKRSLEKLQKLLHNEANCRKVKPDRLCFKNWPRLEIKVTPRSETVMLELGKKYSKKDLDIIQNDFCITKVIINQAKQKTFVEVEYETKESSWRTERNDEYIKRVVSEIVEARARLY